MPKCSHCGKEVDSIAIMCPHCGNDLYEVLPKTTTTSSTYSYKTTDPEENKSLKGALVGVLLTWFIGCIGLILCLFLGNKKCRTAAIITFILSIIINIIIMVVYKDVFQEYLNLINQ